MKGDIATPGTVGVERRSESLRIHLLDRTMPIEEKIRDMENRVVPLFGVALDEPTSGESNPTRPGN